jgi:hypothetical protein
MEPPDGKSPDEPLNRTANLAIAVQSDRGLIGGQGSTTNFYSGITGKRQAPVDPQLAYEEPVKGIKSSFSSVAQSNFLGSGNSQVISGTIEKWASSWAPIVVRFDANWVTRRSFGSCYVRLPSLTGNSVAVTDTVNYLYKDDPSGYSKLSDEARRRVAASYGRVRLAVDANILDDKSTPRPSNLDATQSEATWTCSSSRFDAYEDQISSSRRGIAIPGSEPLPSGSSCGGFAVVTSPWYEPFNAMTLIVVGVVISMAIEFIYRELGGRS